MAHDKPRSPTNNKKNKSKNKPKPTYKLSDIRDSDLKHHVKVMDQLKFAHLQREFLNDPDVVRQSLNNFVGGKPTDFFKYFHDDKKDTDACNDFKKRRDDGEELDAIFDDLGLSSDYRAAFDAYQALDPTLLESCDQFHPSQIMALEKVLDRDNNRLRQVVLKTGTAEVEKYNRDIGNDSTDEEKLEHVRKLREAGIKVGVKPVADSVSVTMRGGKSFIALLQMFVHITEKVDTERLGIKPFAGVKYDDDTKEDVYNQKFIFTALNTGPLASFERIFGPYAQGKTVERMMGSTDVNQIEEIIRKYCKNENSIDIEEFLRFIKTFPFLLRTLPKELCPIGTTFLGFLLGQIFRAPVNPKADDFTRFKKATIRICSYSLSKTYIAKVSLEYEVVEVHNDESDIGADQSTDATRKVNGVEARRVYQDMFRNMAVLGALIVNYSGTHSPESKYVNNVRLEYSAAMARKDGVIRESVWVKMESSSDEPERYNLEIMEILSQMFNKYTNLPIECRRTFIYVKDQESAKNLASYINSQEMKIPKGAFNKGGERVIEAAVCIQKDAKYMGNVTNLEIDNVGNGNHGFNIIVFVEKGGRGIGDGTVNNVILLKGESTGQMSQRVQRCVTPIKLLDSDKMMPKYQEMMDGMSEETEKLVISDVKEYEKDQVCSVFLAKDIWESTGCANTVKALTEKDGWVNMDEFKKPELEGSNACYTAKRTVEKLDTLQKMIDICAPGNQESEKIRVELQKLANEGKDLVCNGCKKKMYPNGQGMKVKTSAGCKCENLKGYIKFVWYPDSPGGEKSMKERRTMAPTRFNDGDYEVPDKCMKCEKKENDENANVKKIKKIKNNMQKISDTITKLETDKAEVEKKAESREKEKDMKKICKDIKRKQKELGELNKRLEDFEQQQNSGASTGGSATGEATGGTGENDDHTGGGQNSGAPTGESAGETTEGENKDGDEDLVENSDEMDVVGGNEEEHHEMDVVGGNEEKHHEMDVDDEDVDDEDVDDEDVDDEDVDDEDVDDEDFDDEDVDDEDVDDEDVDDGEDSEDDDDVQIYKTPKGKGRVDQVLQRRNVLEDNVLEDNVSESNVSDSNVSDSNVSESNVSESNVSESNVSESNEPREESEDDDVVIYKTPKGKGRGDRVLQRRNVSESNMQNGDSSGATDDAYEKGPMENSKGSKRKFSDNGHGANAKRKKKCIGIGAIHLSTDTTMYTKDKEIVDTLVRNPHIAKKFRGRLDKIPKKLCKKFSSSLVNNGYKSKDKFAEKNIKLVKDLIRRIAEGEDFEEVFMCLGNDGDSLHWYLLQEAANPNVDWIRVVGEGGHESWIGIEIILNELGSMITDASLFGTVDEILAKIDGR